MFKASLWWVGTLLGIITLMGLIQKGFDLGPVAPFELILDVFDRSLNWLFMLIPIEPWVEVGLRYARQWTGLNLDLHPHWKYAFVLMWLYFGSDVRFDLARNRIGTAPVTFLWGGLIALIASVASGTVSLDDPSMLAVLFPVAGFVLYEAGRSVWSATFFRPAWYETWWQTFRYYGVVFALGDAVLGIIAVVVGIQAKQIGFSRPNLVALIFFIIALALRNLVVGVVFATKRREQDESWTHCFLRSATARLGVQILTIVGGATFAFALNALV